MWWCRSGKTPGKVTSPSSRRQLRTTRSLDCWPKSEQAPMKTMVSSVHGDCDSETAYKRSRTNAAAPPRDALTPVRQRQTSRCRKQTCMFKLSDSGFEEELRSSPILSSYRVDVSPLWSDEPPAGQLSTWYLQYGDIGYKLEKEKEAHFHPCKSLARQPQLTAEARCTLISWLIPLHKYFHLSFESCCLAVNIVDRFLASTPVAADCFQLVGVAALLLACKQVEVCSPRISHLLSFCCDAFTKEQLCNLECLILLRLKFRLAAPTLAFFLDYYTNCIETAHLVADKSGGNRFAEKHPGRRCSNFAQKVCELSLADYAFNKYPPSLIASSALWLSIDLMKTEQEEQWGSLMDELCTQPASAQACWNSEGDSMVFLKDHHISLSEGSYNHSLVHECKDKLKLLVSLNKETLELISSM